MAQSEVTATPPNPTPPTNLLCVFGGTPPSTADLPFTDDGAAGALNTVTAPTNGTPAEATGLIVTVTAPGSRAECPTQMISTMGAYTSNPNADHASNKPPAVLPTITGLLPVAPVSGQGQVTLTVNGTGFQMDSQVAIAGVPQATQYNSPTQLIVPNATKRPTAGNLAITVVTNGTPTAATNWVFS